jgi:hypothetical protein
MTHEIDTIPLDAVNIKGGTQSRVELNQATIAEYVELIRASVELPPVITFFDGSTFWLADGFHRFNAHLDADATEIASEVRTGTQRDAILFSVGANASHGLRRTNEDKRRAVMTLLNDPEWSTWSSEAIAKACAVSPRTVSGMRISANAEIAPLRTVERNGATYEQNTANIGKAKSVQAGAQSEPKTTETRMDTRFEGGGKRPNSASVGRVSSRAAIAPGMPDDGAPDLVRLADELQRENEAYQRQIKSLEADDKNAELVRLNTYADQLNGRLQGEVTTRNEAQKMVKHYADLLAKVRKALNVESNKDILSALERK